MDLAASFEDIVPDVTNYAAEQICPEMGLTYIAYFFRRAEFNKRIQHFVRIIRILYPGKQLSVRV